MNFGEKVDLVRRCLRLVRGAIGRDKMLVMGRSLVPYEDLHIEWAPRWSASLRCEEEAELVLAVRKGEIYHPDTPPDRIFRVNVLIPSFSFRTLNIEWTDEKRGEAILAALRPKMLLDDLADV